MANRNHTFFYIALIITALVHLLAIKPIATWLSHQILPNLSEENLEIDLAEIKARNTPLAKVQPKTQQQKPDLLDLENSGKEKFLNPAEKKILDPSLTEDQPDTGKQIASRSEPPTESREQPLPPKPKPKQEPEKEPEEKPEEEVLSPIFIRKPEIEKPVEEKPIQQAEKKKTVPEEIEKTFRGEGPEKTDDKNLDFSMNTYKWTFQRYMENWAHDIQKWWKPPMDYAMGNVPEGGDMWIQVRLSKTGKLLGYRILGSDVTAEMELMVIQALVGSLSRPALPDQFPDGWLLVNWHFVYPPMRPELDMRR